MLLAWNNVFVSVRFIFPLSVSLSNQSDVTERVYDFIFVITAPDVITEPPVERVIITSQLSLVSSSVITATPVVGRVRQGPHCQAMGSLSATKTQKVETNEHLKLYDVHKTNL